jgi:acyl-CoA hydrolase
MRHAQCQVVTVAIDQMTFHEPIRVGDLVRLDASLTFVGRTSMETRIDVIAEDPISGSKTHTNTAYAVYVALDQEGHPRPVPGLIAESELEKQRLAQGRERQKYRLEQRQKERHRVEM